MILSTCNRVEIYAAGPPEQMPETRTLCRSLVEFHGVTAESRTRIVVSYHDDMGSSTISSRSRPAWKAWFWVRGRSWARCGEAYRTAVERKTVGPIFHPVFQAALRVGKLVRERTGMDQGKLSVASVAVDLAEKSSTHSLTRMCS